MVLFVLATAAESDKQQITVTSIVVS